MMMIPAARERCASIDVGNWRRDWRYCWSAQNTFFTGIQYDPVLSMASLLQRSSSNHDRSSRKAGTVVPTQRVLTSAWLSAGPTITATANPRFKRRKKDKTDFLDAIDLCHKHRHGMLKGSYLPERGIVELRDLTRRREKLLGALGSEKNRIQKVLETANVKIGNVIGMYSGYPGRRS